MIGPFLAPLFILPFIGLAGPMAMFSVIALSMLFVVWKYLPESAHMPVQPVKMDPAPGATGDAKEKPMWRDPRLKPFLIYGFIVAVCQTAQGQTLGFLIIDKLGKSPTEAQGFIAIAMMFGAMAGLLSQWGIIRMFEMTPRQLLRWGVAVAALGNLIVAFQPTYAAVVAGYAISSLGFGLARPGFTAGSSLAVGMHEKARAALRTAAKLVDEAALRAAVREGPSRALRAQHGHAAGHAGLRLQEPAAGQRRSQAGHTGRFGHGDPGEERRGFALTSTRRRLTGCWPRSSGDGPCPGTGSRRP